ncbi:hypothetical protein DS909_18860 [Phaeobacter gallaeciensis]|uniref:Uncharacterized protein n=1 Tax=Phaeobacter gallaeciensis TaxID=60890 RepID=A0A366WP69_9RHOB|nr:MULTISPECIES: hypothetical protein [Roseobacteraceae]MBT8166790.1 hypothetical protein [Falsiruegeria litorea]RBW51644.1 hypothetical protein DS909_18860 [Phaeobacter gallaeciensis]
MFYFQLTARVISFCILFVFPNSSIAEGFDPCPRLQGADDASPGTFRLAWDWFASDQIEAYVAYSDQEFFFTIKAGRFVNVRCDDQQFEEQEMYPLGLMVRPIAYVSLPVFEKAREDRAILVITEYGQRKLIKESDIAPVVQHAVYLFADAPGNAGVCRTEDDCPGNSMDLCKPRIQCRYVVSARFGYAIAAEKNPRARAAIAAYLSIKNPQSDTDVPDFLIDREQVLRMQQLEEVACQPFSVKAYAAGGKLHQPRDSYFSLCAERRAAGAKANAIRPIKIVSMAAAKRAFTWHLDGSFHRRFNVPESGQDTTLGRVLINYRITSSKECGVELSDVAEGAISGGLKASFSAGFLELEASAETSITTKITRTLSADDYLLMSTYMMDPIMNAPEVDRQDDSDLWFFRVLFRSKCEDGTPKSATSIIIHYNRLDGQVLEVRVSDDLRVSYLDAWAEYGYKPDNSANALREGHFWIVPDLDGYFIWRDTLRNFIEVDNTVTSRLLGRHPKNQRAHVRDFFVHLMLAAAFNHRNPSP